MCEQQHRKKKEEAKHLQNYIKKKKSLEDFPRLHKEKGGANNREDYQLRERVRLPRPLAPVYVGNDGNHGLGHPEAAATRKNKMSTPARRRLMRDFKRLQEDPPTGVSGAPTDNNIMIWNAVIFGPHDTPFEDGTFKLTIEFTEEYPNKPPTVRFVSKMFHPNVYADGGICLDILQNRWSPTYDVSAILTSIQSLLSDPNPNSPANSMAAQLYKENRREYEKRVKACVEQSFID